MEMNFPKDPSYQQLCPVSTTDRQVVVGLDNVVQDIVHYAFESVSQLEAVQEEVVLDNNNGLLLPAGETQCLVSTSNCNPVIRDDNQCVDMVLEEEIITDTQHHVGEDDDEEEQMMMIMDTDDFISATPPSTLPPSPKPMLTTLTSVPDIFSENNSFAASNETSTRTPQNNNKPLSVSSSTLPIVKIVPTVNSNKFVMKIQSKEPPDLSPSTQSAAGESQCARGLPQAANISESNGLAMENEAEDEVDNEEGELEEEEVALVAATVNEVGKSVKVHREMKQLQKMVDSSKVLTDFMTTTSSTSVESKGRKSRKAPGRPKKKVLDSTAAAAAVPPTDHESPKRQSTRTLAAKKGSPDFLELFGSYLNQSNSVASETSGLNDADELSMDYHSDNETNESVASGGTDSMPLKLAKVNSGNSNVVEPAPKVSQGECRPGGGGG